jgi:hypothetical protein
MDMQAHAARAEGLKVVRAMLSDTASIADVLASLTQPAGVIAGTLLAMLTAYGNAKNRFFAHDPIKRFATVRDPDSDVLMGNKYLMAEGWLCNAVVNEPEWFGRLSADLQDMLRGPLAALLAQAINTYAEDTEKTLTWLESLPIDVHPV